MKKNHKEHPVFDADGMKLFSVFEPYQEDDYVRVQAFLSDKATAAVLKEKLYELEEDARQLKREMEDCIALGAACDHNERWGYELLNETLHKKLGVLAKDKMRLRAHLARCNGTRTSMINIEAAKSVPIETLLGSPKMSSGGRLWYNCIFHNEDTPSLCVYKNTNTFYCFGCTKWGSVIDIYMQQYSVDFLDAAKHLSGANTLS